MVASLRTAGILVALILATVGLFLVIDGAGSTQLTPGLAAAPQSTDKREPTAPPHRVNEEANPFVSLLVALTAVIVAGRLMSHLFLRLGQPPVIGEVVAGIALGPSLLGRVWPEATEFLLPPAATPYLNVIAHFGIILYMFVVGLELDLDAVRKHASASLAISEAGIVVPFLLGSAIALFLYPRVAAPEVPFTHFALFLGVAMSITAFPVLARILGDLSMQRTPLGALALACAAVDDAAAWCLLAFVVGVTRSESQSAFVIIGLASAYVGFMLAVVRPALARLLPWIEASGNTRAFTALLFVALLLSALATEAIGIHAIFGAFLLGAVMPHNSAIARDLIHKLEDLVTILFLPAFFAFTGLRTQIGLVVGLEEWLLTALIIAVATAGKFGGAALAARFVGLSWKESSALGVLMNTRGLMELIVLNIGLDLKIISPTVFAMMVLMAIVTTMATAPLLRLLDVPRNARNEGE